MLLKTCPRAVSPPFPDVRPGADKRRTTRCHAPWDLHELRHSAPTHLGEAGASLLLLMAKSRHKKPENVGRYFEPSAEVMGVEEHRNEN
ncbi:hypothetical protein E1288_27875 [Saccharopolyspora elongata]|uniref:Integrase n=1 Tax=Saccharopolyspora elongata TaxID=2530387 RepID=A0A4R4YFZ6_9PSEU|nr:hypothetical protein E1288_27875 [Saccharopolyspora elongata]